MKNIYVAASIFIFALSLLNCNVKSAAISAANDTHVKPDKDLITNQECHEWQRQYDEISEGAKSDLQTEGIAFGRSGGYILSPALMPDCKRRVEIGRFIWKVMLGDDKESDREFARENSKEIVRVMKHTWNYYSDGATHEKYGLLINEGIKDEDIAPFIGELLKTEGFDPLFKPNGGEPELFYVLFSRPLPSLKPIILESLKQEENNGDLLTQVFASYLLYRDTDEPQYLSKLKAVCKNPKLSSKSREILVGIVEKIKIGFKPEYKDFDDFMFSIFDSMRSNGAN